MYSPLLRYRRIQLAHEVATAEVRMLSDGLCRVPGIFCVEPSADGCEFLVHYDLRLVRLEEIEVRTAAFGAHLSTAYYYVQMRQAIHRTERAAQRVVLERDAQPAAVPTGPAAAPSPAVAWDGPLPIWQIDHSPVETAAHACGAAGMGAEHV